MSWWDDLFKSPARRKSEQDKKRREALTKAKTALRREKRAISKRQSKGEELRRQAVAFEKEGKSNLAKQSVRQLVQIDREVTARTMALSNMEFTLEQVQVNDNYDEFVRGMKVVADIEELAHESVDPDEVRERLTNLAQRNQDIIEPWVESSEVETAHVGREGVLSPEEQEAYDQIVNTAAAGIESAGPSNVDAVDKMDSELEKKMDELLGKE